MMISRSAFLIFLKFSFLGLLGGFKGKKLAKMKNNNYIWQALYLNNSITYDHGFWYTCVKWQYFHVFFFIVLKLSIFRSLEGGGGGGGGGEWVIKGESIAQNENSNYIRHAPYLWNSIADDHHFCYTA